MEIKKFVDLFLSSKLVPNKQFTVKENVIFRNTPIKFSTKLDSLN